MGIRTGNNALKNSEVVPDALSRFAVLAFFVSSLLFLVSLLPGGRPEPLLFFFNLAPTEMSARRASSLPALRRWVSVEAAVSPALYYLSEGYKSNPEKNGCRTYLIGSLKSPSSRPLPFRALVEDEPATGCASTGLRRVGRFSELPPHHLAKIAPGDFTLTELLRLKTPEDYDKYMAGAAAGKFKGFLRTKNLEQFPGDVTRGGRARCWLDVNAGPSFFSTVVFLLMAASALLMAALRALRAGKANAIHGDI